VRVVEVELVVTASRAVLLVQGVWEHPREALPFRALLAERVEVAEAVAVVVAAVMVLPAELLGTAGRGVEVACSFRVGRSR